ncbi:Aspartate--ammonia ligase, partial [termite gut metagenome]
GINDDLNGVERAVSFPIKDLGEVQAEVVHSLAKWKRITLADYKIEPDYGIYTDMNAIRSDEELGNLHSLYVDQWDWEKVITRENRNIDFLKEIVNRIYAAMIRTEYAVCEMYPQIKPSLPQNIYFIHAEELRKRYPNMDIKSREDAITKEYGAVFIIGIGCKLGDGIKHDGRAPDYDDYSTPGLNGLPGLNGDLLVWNPILQRAFELSSMGIRVDKDVLRKQLKEESEERRLELYFHKRLIEGSLPLSIGGGIGQSRLCMFYLHKAHIGEIQASIWPSEMREECSKLNIHLI